ncbi:hypothetical protein F0L68_12495 [Solihabitans fulvus]|uniref:Uncharacterized protein n=1 Tax=Solihabitans fulvus TaxID=1892852 RepID=A0A5B2XHM4_9PSEU|nr:hypothetical protein [Solihabitans fulvus]KAA2262706.1 hypothetical protein F0L68_12495 [Solihabitans fulvus]
MVTTDQGPARKPIQQQVRGLPVWYFVLAGLLVASFDISSQFRSNYPLVAALPLVLIALHVTLWFLMLSRRRRYIRSVWRSPRARLLVVLLFGARLLLQLVLTRVTNGVAPLHTYAHLIMGLALLVLTTTGAWFDQWLILRTVNRRTEQTEERPQ